MHVEVRFEKEGISTFDGSADMIFSVMAAAAEMESRSISENVKWSYQRKLEQGIRHVGSNRIFGYDEINGKLTPNKDAWIVKLIFEEYAGGRAPRDIMAMLAERGVTRMRTQNPMNWTTIQRLLRNEVYVGDRRLQKKPHIDVITKKPDPTVPYTSRVLYNDHEAIVRTDVWDDVQERLQKTETLKQQGLSVRCTNHFLYGKVFCAECGEPYRRYTARDKTGLYKTWRCRGHVAGKCDSPHVRESVLIGEILRQLGLDDCLSDVYEWGLQESDDRVLVGKKGITVEDSKEICRIPAEAC